MKEPNERKIIKTEDGSTTLYVPAIDEHYHSTKGAFTESEHIFIHMGLEACKRMAPEILEVGFGTGLNAWITLQAAEKAHRKISYTSIELYPVDWNLVNQLKYSDNPLFKNIHQAPWNVECEITPYFKLTKVQEDIHKVLENPQKLAINISNPDVVYYDAFSPEKQPEMWEEKLFRELYKFMNPQGIVTTYCAKGVVRRTLQAAGFKVERLPGPPGGKREILRATKEIKTTHLENT